MPRGDRRGPEGMGPRTGRGLGLCNGYDSPGFTKDRFGGGMGRGRGFGFGRGIGFRGAYGRGYGWRAYPENAPNAGDELQALKDEAKFMKENLDTVNKRIKELENS